MDSLNPWRSMNPWRSHRIDGGIHEASLPETSSLFVEAREGSAPIEDLQRTDRRTRLKNRSKIDRRITKLVLRSTKNPEVFGFFID
ncbi:hypothetical protein ACOSQ2_010428 [Xanthoceras sorbifolium]